jgi:hypothetical protein
VSGTEIDLAVDRDVEATERLVDRITAAAQKIEGVARLSPGPAATYLPHRTVPGVVVAGGVVTVAVVAWYGRPFAETAEQVRTAVRRAVGDVRVDVVIDDIETEGA